jgi:glycosyltransferase involved in cell wall biosynthesis
MKISMIGPVYPYRGGIAYFTTLLAKKLSEAGHDVQMISFKKQYPAWLYPGESDKDHSPGREKVDADYVLTPLNPITWRQTLQAVLSFQPDKVIIPWWVTFWGPAFWHIITCLKRNRINVSVLIHNTMPHEARFWDRFLTRHTLEPADSYIVMTEKEKQRLLALLPDAKNIATASLPIFHAFKHTGLPKTELRRQLGLAEDRNIVLFFGFVRPYKGLHVLIDAMQILEERGSQADLLVVGEFWDQKQPYLTHISQAGLSDRVHIFDSYIPDDEIAAYFEASDVFAAPYVDGTQSAALKTAFGFGLPAVATDVINDDMVVSMGEHCKIVPAGDADSLAKAIETQLRREPQKQSQIDDLVARSWEDMLAAVNTHPQEVHHG